jgi:hypothetical protein
MPSVQAWLRTLCFTYHQALDRARFLTLRSPSRNARREGVRSGGAPAQLAGICKPHSEVQMRKLATLCAAFVFLTFADLPAAAQMGGTGVQLGAKAGLSFSTLSVEDDEGVEIDRLTAFGGGGFLRFPLGGLALQPELLFMRKGARLSEADLDALEVDFKIDYVEIPLLLVLPIATQSAVSPYLFAGPAVAFEVACSVEVEIVGEEEEFDCDDADAVDIEVERKKVDVGATLGAGLQFAAGPGALLLEGRYTFGLLDINDSAEDNSIRNRSGAVMIGYAISLSR